MNISRFFGATNREALRQVRLALGPDALIVSNRRVNGGVEILAADPTAIAHLEGDAPPVQPTAAQPAMPSPMSPMGAYAAAAQAAYGPSARDATPLVTPAPSSPPPAAMPQEEAEPQPGLMDAIGAMRGALETRIDELMWGNQLRRAPQAAVLFQSLLEFGFSTALSRAMLKRLPERLSARAAFQWARDELISHLPVPANEEALWKPGLVLALVGPTGVGKTTTIAKLAARCVRRYGPDKLVLITTDTYRIGAHEQLKIYGQMLRAPVHVVRTADELQKVVQSIRPDQVVLIDNVGISQRDRYIGEQAALLAAAGREVTRLLVLNAASHGETLDEVARSYAADGGTPLRGCIITKVDEATRLGAALDTTLRYRLPIHYVSIGQKVPEHLVFMQASELVGQALTHTATARALYAPTEADFAALMAMSRQPETSESPMADSHEQQMRMLPRLLSMAAGGAVSLTADDLRDGCEFIDELTCSSEAYDLWRSHTAADSNHTALETWLRHMLRIVQNEWGDSGQKHLLAVHDQLGLRNAGESPAVLRATLILNEHGTPLSSPMQQLALQGGWLSSCGDSRPQAPALRHALMHQVAWLRQQAAELPIAHLFDGASPVLLRELAATDLHWLAQVPAIMRIHMEDGPTTAQALAKTLPHHPAADPGYLFALAEVAGAPAADRTLWVAATPVTIATRGQRPLALQMVSARLVDRSTGKVVKSVLGLHPGLDLPTDKLASWLIVKTEAREALRHAAAAWALLSTHDGQDAMQHKALLSAQTGLAAWQLRQSPLATRSRQVAALMLGRKDLSSTTATQAALKLFTLKEMMGA